MPPHVRPRQSVPDVTLPALAPETGDPLPDVSLRDLRGRPVLLVFLRWLG